MTDVVDDQHVPLPDREDDVASAPERLLALMYDLVERGLQFRHGDPLLYADLLRRTHLRTQLFAETDPEVWLWPASEESTYLVAAFWWRRIDPFAPPAPRGEP
jgi:hypothetical protein